LFINKRQHGDAGNDELDAVRSMVLTVCYKFDFTADLTGIGNRPEEVIK